MNVLVTGADGFIGSRVVELLVLKGHAVTALVLYNQFSSFGWLDDVDVNICEKVKIVLGDVRDPNTVAIAMESVDAVIHLAALIAIPYSYSAVRSYIDVNVNGTSNLLEAAKSRGVKKFVQASTSEVYGSAQYVPIDEQHRLFAQSPYAASKIGADQLALAFYGSYGMPVSVIRPFNTYGPRQSARAVIPTVISQLKTAGKVVSLGSLYPTRDFTYVDDTARGFIASVESLEDIGQVCNLGSNFEISIGETVEIIAAEMGVSDYEIRSDFDRIRPAKSEVERLWSDNSKAKKLLNWEPELNGIDGLKSGISKTVTWHLNHPTPFGFGNNRTGYVI